MAWHCLSFYATDGVTASFLTPNSGTEALSAVKAAKATQGNGWIEFLSFNEPSTEPVRYHSPVTNGQPNQ